MTKCLLFIFLVPNFAYPIELEIECATICNVLHTNFHSHILMLNHVNLIHRHIPQDADDKSHKLCDNVIELVIILFLWSTFHFLK